MSTLAQDPGVIRRKRGSLLAQWFFRVETIALLFYLLVMVRLATGEADSEETRAATAAAVESGDLFKQLAYTALFGLLTLFWVKKKGFQLPRSVGFVPILLLIWILASSYWAFAPNVAIRRGVLLVFVFFSLAIVIDLLGPYRSLDALYRAMGICTVLSVAAVFLLPSVGRHPMTEIDQSIAGGWRGIFIHKNTAGAVMAMSALMFLNFGLTRRKRLDWIFFSLAAFFVFGSKAKTALGLLCMLIPVVLAYRLACRDLRFRGFAVVMTILSLSAIITAVIGYSDRILAIFMDPDAFTGRVAIWQAAIEFGMDHFWLGSGYSSLWAVGDPPPIMTYARYPYLEFITHSHNGYVEMFATTGILGLVLAVWFTVCVPFYQLMRMVGRKHADILAVLFGAWLYGVLQNFMETQLFTRDREIWVFYFSAIMIVRQLYSEEFQMSVLRIKKRGTRRRVLSVQSVQQE